MLARVVPLPTFAPGFGLPSTALGSGVSSALGRERRCFPLHASTRNMDRPTATPPSNFIRASRWTRRRFLGASAALGLGAVVGDLLPAYALGAEGSAGPADGLAGDRIALEIAERRIAIGPHQASATVVNGTIPGPLIRLREGQDVVIDVTNRLREGSSIHWHGIILPPGMDGVPRVRRSATASPSTRAARTGTTATRACRSRPASSGRSSSSPASPSRSPTSATTSCCSRTGRSRIRSACSRT